MKTTWTEFLAINAQRRSIRDFDGRPIDEAALKEVLLETLKAPSSGNLQPYSIHWVRDPALKERLAEACNGQRAARSASALLVIVSSVTLAKQTVRSQRAWVEGGELADASKQYHRKQLEKFARFLRFGPFWMLGLVRAVVSWLMPSRALLPVGTAGSVHWATRSSIYAAQQLLIAAAAHGFDTCPMEGFDPAKVAHLLNLPRGAVVPLVIAVGWRAPNAHLEPQWRRPFEEAVVVH